MVKIYDTLQILHSQTVLRVVTPGLDDIELIRGTPAPNNVVVANRGTLYIRDGTFSELWFKESGIGTDTGWRQVELV